MPPRCTHPYREQQLAVLVPVHFERRRRLQHGVGAGRAVAEVAEDGCMVEQ